MLVDQLEHPLARDPVDEGDPRVVARHQLELGADRDADGPGPGVAAEQGQRPVVAIEPAQGADEVGHSLAALEPAHVEEAERIARRPLPARRRRLGRVGAHRVADPHVPRDRLAAVEAPVGLEHVAARPDDHVGLAQGEALELEHRPDRELVVEVPVEGQDHLRARVEPDRDAGVGEQRIAAPARLQGHRALAVVVGELDQVGTAVGVGAAERVEHVRAPAVEVAVERAVVVVVEVGREVELDPRVDAGVAGGAELAELLLVARRRDQLHLGDVGERGRGPADVVPHAAAPERVELARDDGDPWLTGGHEPDVSHCPSTCVRLTYPVATDERQRDRDRGEGTLEELPHPLASQGHPEGARRQAARAIPASRAARAARRLLRGRARRVLRRGRPQRLRASRRC